jgi:spore coat polysaccharide biosynthesis protein SpsF
MRTAVIIQARMGSSRLPGKVMKILEGRSVLSHVIHRIKAIQEVDEVVVATTLLPSDQIIVEESHRYGVTSFRGDEQDVLRRYYEAAKQIKADVVVRITSDCPLIDPDIVADVIRWYHTHNLDYVSNSLVPSYPRGLDTEVFSFRVLEEANFFAREAKQREHVTPYIYQNPTKYKLGVVKSQVDYSKYRWTLDTTEDWELISKIYQKLYLPEGIIAFQEVVALLEREPWLHSINAHIEQKKLID